jgi:tetratricopeptide (TPR) repeat protein
MLGSGATAVRRTRRYLCVAFCLIFVAAAYAQRGGLNDPQHLLEVSTSYETAAGTGVLIFKVSAERTSNRLDRQALVRLINPADHSAVWQATEDAQGVFTNVAYGSYDAEISAVGFLTEHKQLQVMNSIGPQEISIVLHRDPSAIDLDVAATVMSPKARKEAKHAILLLKSNKLDQAKKQLGEAYKLAPSSPDLNFLLGYVYFQQKDYAQAGNYLGTATNLSPHNAQALTLLGRTGLERADYPAARSALEQAVLADADNWLPHNLLADAYLRQKDYGKARDEAQTAIAKGKSAASPAQLVLGEALVGLGNGKDAVQALNKFLEESPRHPMAGQVRGLLAEINATMSAPPAGETSAATEIHIPGVDPLAAMPVTGLTVKSWQPPGVDDIQPSVAAAVSCPSDEVIEKSGQRVQEFVNDIARLAAVEELFHQSLDSYGIPFRTETRKFNYVATILESQPGVLTVNEFRADKMGLAGYPDQIASTGFASLALVFHPHMRDNFEMKCEGLGDWLGQATWLVHFRQREDRPNRMHSYKVGNQIHAVALKGRAWISTDKFQIVRIEADMVDPMPTIQLLSEHQVVEYGAVPFPRKHTTLWLPKSAEIYFDFRKHRFYRRHSFDHYMLYSVDTEEKRKEPVAPSAKDAEKKSS